MLQPVASSWVVSGRSQVQTLPSPSVCVPVPSSQRVLTEPSEWVSVWHPVVAS